MSQSLKDRVALVTGASSGIGEAAALALAEAGAKVAVSARRADRLEALVDKIRSARGDAIALPADVTDESAATKIVSDTIDHFGRLDILVNSAGVMGAGGVENTTNDHWQRVMDINVMATLSTCRAAIAPMRDQGGGDIINITSLATFMVNGIFGPYCTSKHAIKALTEGLRQEVGPYGIRVCSIMPGRTSTEVADSIDNTDLRDVVANITHSEGAMSPDIVGSTIVFIASLPPGANVSEILIRPTGDVEPHG